MVNASTIYLVDFSKLNNNFKNCISDLSELLNFSLDESALPLCYGLRVDRKRLVNL